MFRITDGKGFHITFENGYTVSVQFGMWNYCDNYGADFKENTNEELGEKGSSTAECAILMPDGGLLPLECGDDVTNRSTPEEVLELLSYAATLPKENQND